MTIYNMFKYAIKEKPERLAETLQRIDMYNIRGGLTDAERDELYEQARGAAQPDIDVRDEIQRLWAAVREMQKEIETLKNSAPEGGTDAPEDGEDMPESETVQEFVQPSGAHDAYYAGNVVGYNGKVYTCVAPAGVACVWSPDVMPDYWEEQ